ncbi:MAG: hypothetical protein HQ541_07165 [Mariniphaga sp.]|nr:hypothetical protein [Mariniphaga sp.]
MKRNYFTFFSKVLLALLFAGLIVESSAQIVTPEEFFGFKPGADREVFNYQPLIDYMQQLDEASPRVKMIDIGASPMGKRMYVVFLSSEENINNLDRLKHINKELAINTNLSETQLEEYISEGKVFIMAALSMHSTEVAPTQAAPIVAHTIATTSDPDMLKWLDDVVYMMVPNHNPDGMDLIIDYYKKTKDTKYEGANLPEVYHKYVGHDNNRDFVTLTQSDNAAVARLYNKTWFPQVMVEKHQMGSYGPRYFVPPMHDPIAENIDEKIWNWTWIFGSNMAKDMARDGCEGISQHYLFDDYWPGSTETALWKNVIGLLTEAASVQIAKPIYIEKSELRATGKGLGEYKKSINMPLPWEGGWWHLSDIVKFELSSTWSLLKTGSIHRKDILINRNVIALEEVQKGLTQAPYFYIFPASQHDDGELADMLTLLDEHGVNVFKTTDDLVVEGRVVKKGDYVVPLAQPFRSFVKEVLEKQKFPERHYMPGGELIKPYDITSWSLPLHRGLKSDEINTPQPELAESIEKVEFPLVPEMGSHGELKALIFPVRRNESFKAVFNAMGKGIDVFRAGKNMDVDGVKIKEGDFVVPFKMKDMEKWHEIMEEFKTIMPSVNEEIKEGIVKIEMPEIALIETSFHDMDAGWTRYVLDTYNIPYTVLNPGEVALKQLSAFDVIIMPDSDKEILLSGKNKSSSSSTYSIPAYDPQFTKGLTKDGQQDLVRFVHDGGTIVSWGRSARLFMGAQSLKTQGGATEDFQLPVSDISESLAKQKLYCPGSLLTIDLKEGHPLTYGMQGSANVFTRGRPVFSTSIPYFDTDRRVIGSYPEDDIVASGYVDKEELLAGKAAMVWAKKGKGQFVFYGFYPQFRASTTGTYKLLFNALLLQ